MTPTRLPEHPAFLRLSDAEKNILFQAGELWEAPAGAVLYFQGDSGEDLIFLFSGRLEYSDRRAGEKRWMAGELWGEDRLESPEPVARNLVAAEDCIWIRWSRRGLVSLLSSSPALRRGLDSLRDEDGILLSGLGGTLPAAITGRPGRRLRASLRPAAGGLFLSVVGAGLIALAGATVENLPPAAPLAAPALFLGWFLVFLFVRMLTEYGIDSDAITSRSFDWSRFAVESRHIPIDRIQGVEVERNGLYRRILKYGTIIVKTSALEGELMIRDVKTPEILAKEISALGRAGGLRVEGRDRESIRRSLEESGFADRAPVMIRPSVSGNSKESGIGELRFRKSMVVLTARLILPLLVTAVPLLAAEAVAGILASTAEIPVNFIRLAALLPLFWAWYIFEDWRNDSFRVSGGYAVDLYRKPLGLKETRRQVDLASVQNIRTEQKGLLSVLFRFGDVILVTAGGASDTVFKNVSRPWIVQDSLFRAREEGLRIGEERQREERKDDLLRFAEAMDQIRKN